MQCTDFFKKTRSIFLWSRLLNTPFYTIISCLLFIIIYRELHATPFQVATIIVLKPMASLFSPYWSVWIEKRQDRLVANIVWANILKYVPFLCFPWFQNVWWCIFSFGFYMIFLRGVVPAWMEIIKLNIQGKAREKVFAIGSNIDYLGSAILPIAFGSLMDRSPTIWPWLFFGAACIGILSTLLLACLPLQVESMPRESFNMKQSFYRPWQSSWNLAKSRPDFAKFQVGFMLGASALMMLHTALPKYFVTTLNLSYQEIMFAIAMCKGIGFAISSPFWVKLFHKINIFYLSAWVTLFAALFPVVLFCGYFNAFAPYFAYIIYGIMQAGSELSWNMSGPVFAREQESSPFTSLNILAAGIRGCIAPIIGSVIGAQFGASTVMCIAFIMCIFATERMRVYGKQHSLLAYGW